MSRIRYICLSDLHLGADNSLLTKPGKKAGDVDPSEPSAVLELLVACLHALVKHNDGDPPTLLLNGDALELALAEDNVALMAFERFIELLYPAGANDLVQPEIILNPGNHDHHLWEVARERQYVEFIQGKRGKKSGPHLPAPWHTTQMFSPDMIGSSVLNAVIDRHPHLQNRVRVVTVYPNLCIQNSEKSKNVIFTHGHFIEPIYMLMSTIGNFVFAHRKQPREGWEIETENFAWIDFFWSAMGRSGEPGKYIEVMYDMLMVSRSRKKLVRRLARAAGHHWFKGAPKIGEWIGLLFSPFIARLLSRMSALEKIQPEALTAESTRGLQRFVEGPLAKQVILETKDSLKGQTTLAFGHTHKPFSLPLPFHGFEGMVHVYNSGGWVVDTVENQPAHGGAIILIDDKLNTVSVRMYNEGESGKVRPPKVESIDSDSNPLYEQVKPLVDGNRPLWNAFAQVVAESVSHYHKRFAERLNMVK